MLILNPKGDISYSIKPQEVQYHSIFSETFGKSTYYPHPRKTQEQERRPLHKGEEIRTKNTGYIC